MKAPDQTSKADPVVYVLDDDEGMRTVIASVLNTAGYTVLSFGRPLEFLEQYDPAQAGCLVLDIRMPEMSGLEM